MDKAKKFVFPFVFSLACILSYLIVFAVLLKILTDSGAIVGFSIGVIIAFWFIVFLFLFVVPCYCFVYGKKILLNEKRKYLFTLYNSLILAVFCFLVLHIEGETYTYSILLYLWAEIWSVLPLLLHKKKEKISAE
ncbi:MAG: hypothetical protein IJ012_03540 [Clostridia bacterium]|nr:hypothetical protein [Clostridia bacterium]